MKKSLTGAVVLLAGAFMAHSQGTVTFGNYTFFSAGSYMYVSLGSTKLGGSATGPAPTLGNAAAETGNGDDWTVALYGGSGAGLAPSALSPLIDTSTSAPLQANLADGSSDALVGTWYTGDAGAVPGAFNGATATLQVYAWYNEGGLITSYSAAQTAGVPTGFSATGNVVLGGPFAGNTSPPTAPANLPQLGNITLTIPEPSTIALGVMGASAFLMRLRKK